MIADLSADQLKVGMSALADFYPSYKLQGGQGSPSRYVRQGAIALRTGTADVGRVGLPRPGG
jgi:hypothetical protein